MSDELEQYVESVKTRLDDMTCQVRMLKQQLHEANQAYVKWSHDKAALELERDNLKLVYDQFDVPFLEWAQSYLDAGRWAGHSQFDAVKTELLERDAQLDATRAQVQRLREALKKSQQDTRALVFRARQHSFVCAGMISDAEKGIVPRVISHDLTELDKLGDIAWHSCDDALREEVHHG